MIMEGVSEYDRLSSGDDFSDYEGVGLTWWVERLGWFRGTLDEMGDRIDKGPPDRA